MGGWKKIKLRYFNFPFLCKFVAHATAYYCVAHTISRYVGELLICKGPSMLPTIHEGDIVIAERLSQSIYHVCVHSGIPEGDRVESELLPNGRVPVGHVFLQGDNSSVSSDSRAFGPVPEGLVQTRLVLRIWPPSRAGWVSSHKWHEYADGSSYFDKFFNQ